MSANLQFGYDCDGLVDLVRRASDPITPEWQPYLGEIQRLAVWQAKHCAHKARVLGLLPAEDGVSVAATEAA